MLRGTGLPANVSELTNFVLPGPILVEIAAITEIGHSAFTLQNIRQSRIDRADLTGLGAGEADEDDGPIPKYPRSTLSLELTDGTTSLEAMEYRPLRELELGVTPLGYKVPRFPAVTILDPLICQTYRCFSKMYSFVGGLPFLSPSVWS